MNSYQRILSLKNGNKDYDQGLDDAVSALKESFQSCRIVHKKTGLFFNGYNYSGRDLYVSNNTLSITSGKKFLVGKKTDQEILEKFFNTTKVENELHMINHVINPRSKIHAILSNHYADYNTIPVRDFIVDRSKI